MSTQAVCRLVTLDITGTCIAVKGRIASHYVRHAYRHTGISLNEDKVENEIWKQFRAMNIDYPNYGCYDDTMDCRKWWYTIIQRSLVSGGYNGPAMNTICHSLYEDFTTNNCWMVYDDVWPFIKKLKSHGIKIGAISNFDERLSSILDSLGLSPFFDFILCSYTEKIHKPNPLIFKRALELANFKDSETWHIGNDKDKDYKGAIDNGLNSILLLRDDSSKFLQTGDEVYVKGMAGFPKHEKDETLVAKGLDSPVLFTSMHL